jgi:uncharacterized protein (DUF2267 family)
VHGASIAPCTIMLLRIDQLASHVAAHAGVSPPVADYALRAVVRGLGGYLSPAFRQLIAEELPSPLANMLEVAAGSERTSFEERVQLAGLSPSQRRELIASVCKVLAEELSDEAIRALTASLPANVARLFVPSAPAIDHPQPINRQANSVAEPNPHADIKLSSGRRRGISDEPN